MELVAFCGKRVFVAHPDVDGIAGIVNALVAHLVVPDNGLFRFAFFITRVLRKIRSLFKGIVVSLAILCRGNTFVIATAGKRNRGHAGPQNRLHTPKKKPVAHSQLLIEFLKIFGEKYKKKFTTRED